MGELLQRNQWIICCWSSCWIASGVIGINDEFFDKLCILLWHAISTMSTFSSIWQLDNLKNVTSCLLWAMTCFCCWRTTILRTSWLFFWTHFCVNWKIMNETRAQLSFVLVRCHPHIHVGAMKQVTRSRKCTVPFLPVRPWQKDVFTSQFLACKEGAAFSPMRWELSEEHVSQLAVHVLIARIGDTWGVEGGVFVQWLSLAASTAVHCSLCRDCSSLPHDQRATSSAQRFTENWNRNETDMRSMQEDGGSRSCGVSAPFLTVISPNFKQRSLVFWSVGTSIARNSRELQHASRLIHRRMTVTSECSRSTPHSAMRWIASHSWPDHVTRQTVSESSVRCAFGHVTRRFDCSVVCGSFRWDVGLIPCSFGVHCLVVEGLLQWLLTVSFQPLRFEPMTSIRKFPACSAAVVMHCAKAPSGICTKGCFCQPTCSVQRGCCKNALLFKIENAQHKGISNWPERRQKENHSRLCKEQMCSVCISWWLVTKQIPSSHVLVEDLVHMLDPSVGFSFSQTGTEPIWTLLQQLLQQLNASTATPVRTSLLSELMDCYHAWHWCWQLRFEQRLHLPS